MCVKDADGLFLVELSESEYWPLREFNYQNQSDIQSFVDNSTNVPQKMLLNAMEYQKKSDYRMSIFYSALALEIALKEYWKYQLDCVLDDDQIDSFLRGLRNQESINLIPSITSSEKRFGETLFTNRNTIAHHRNRPPFINDDASKAINHVEMILQRLWDTQNIWSYYFKANSQGHQADEIREWVKDNIIEPARHRGLKEVTINAGDIAREVTGGKNIPNINNVLRGKKLLEMCGIRLIQKEGPRESTTTNYTYNIELGI